MLPVVDCAYAAIDASDSATATKQEMVVRVGTYEIFKYRPREANGWRESPLCTHAALQLLANVSRELKPRVSIAHDLFRCR